MQCLHGPKQNTSAATLVTLTIQYKTIALVFVEKAVNLNIQAEWAAKKMDRTSDKCQNRERDEMNHYKLSYQFNL